MKRQTTRKKTENVGDIAEMRTLAARATVRLVSIHHVHVPHHWHWDNWTNQEDHGRLAVGATGSSLGDTTDK